MLGGPIPWSIGAPPFGGGIGGIPGAGIWPVGDGAELAVIPGCGWRPPGPAINADADFVERLPTPAVTLPKAPDDHDQFGCPIAIAIKRTEKSAK